MAKLEIVVSAVDNATGVLRGIGGITTGIFQGIGQAAVGALSNAVGGAFDAIKSSMIDGNAEFERYQTQFGVLLGSADEAKKRLEALAEFGAKTPFELPEVVRADKILQAFGLHADNVAERFGMSGEEIRTVAGDVAAGTGASFEEISTYLGKFASGATGEAISRMQELGIVTRQELKEMGLEFSKSGELLTPIDDAMDVLLVAMKDKFGGMMDAQSSTFEGMMSNLQDWFGAAGRTIGAPLFDVAKNGLGKLLELLNGFMPTLQTMSQYIADALNMFISGNVTGGIENLFGVLETLFSYFNVNGQAQSAFFKSLWGLYNVFTAGNPFEGALAQLGMTLNGVFGPDTANLIMGFIGAVLSVRDAFVESLPMIQTYVGDMMTFLQEQFGTMFPEIATNVTTILTQMAAFWQEHGDTVMAVINFAFRTVSTVIGGTLTIISGLIAAALQLINGDWEGAWTTMQSTLTTFLQSALNIVGVDLETFLETWRGVFDLLGQIIEAGLNKAVEILQGMIANFVSLGENIAKGIADGITAGLQWIIDAAIAAARAAMNAVVGVLGIHSPSKVFADYGKNMMMGMAQGVDKYGYAPAAATAQAAYATTVSVGAINVNGAGNPNMVAAAVRRELEGITQRADNRARI